MVLAALSRSSKENLPVVLQVTGLHRSTGGHSTENLFAVRFFLFSKIIHCLYDISYQLLCWPTSVIRSSQFSKLMLKNNESINYVRWIVIHHCNSSGGYLAVCQFWWTLINVAWNCGENIFAFLKHCVYNLAVFVLIGTGVNTLLK